LSKLIDLTGTALRATAEIEKVSTKTTHNTSEITLFINILPTFIEFDVFYMQDAGNSS
jgi:hypothetical protein